MILRKPPRVESIRGEFCADVVTDDDYALAVQAQSAVLRAQGIERKLLGRLRTRLSLGARDSGQRYYFDADLGIVRRRDPERKKG